MWNSLASYYTCYSMNVMYNDPLALCSYSTNIWELSPYCIDSISRSHSYV